MKFSLFKKRKQVKEIISNQENGFSEAKIIKIAASVSAKNKFWFSEALLECVRRRKIELADMSNISASGESGISAICIAHNTKLIVGDISLLEKNKVNTDWPNMLLGKYKKMTGELIFVVHGEKIAGAILLA